MYKVKTNPISSRGPFSKMHNSISYALKTIQRIAQLLSKVDPRPIIRDDSKARPLPEDKILSES